MLYASMFGLVVLLFCYIIYLLYRQKTLSNTITMYSDEIDTLLSALHKEYANNKEMGERLNKLSSDIMALSASLREEKKRSKSVEVRTGFIMEKMAPFLEAFKHEPKNAHFLGQPIDYIIFSKDEVVFVEVKTGKSKMSPKQNAIKKLIENGKVRFELVRFSDE